MKTFVVNKTSWSYKYLSKFSGKFQGAIYRAEIYKDYKYLPTDFCSYWRKIINLATLHFSLIIALVFELKAIIFFLFNNKLINDTKLFALQPWYIRLELLLGSFGAVAMFLVVVTAFLYCLTQLGRYLIDKSNILGIIGYTVDAAYSYKSTKNKTKLKSDGLIKTWYKARKEKYCPLIEFDLNNKK